MRSIAIPIFCCSWKVTLVPLFLGGDHNFEIRIGSKGSVGQAQCMRRGWEWGLYKAPFPPTPCVGQETLSAQAQPCSPVGFGCAPGPLYGLP
jgi:hypothetical protein